MPKLDDKRNLHPGESQTETAVQKAVCNYSALLKAETRCHRNVGYKNSVSKFHMLKMSKCYELYEELYNGTYKTKYGSEFMIYEPKKRTVTSTRYRDRIPQTSFVTNYYYKSVIPNLIDNNFACMKERGVDKARDKLKELLRNSSLDEFCLKADMKGYFDSINHECLFAEILPMMDDEWAKTYYIDVINCNGKENGIGLGSEINQLSATSFPNVLDHRLSVYKYERYMDDFVVIGSKGQCTDALRMIESEADRLRLTVSKNKTYIQPLTRPVKFLGFTFLLHPTGKVTMKRIRQKLNNERRKARRMFKKGVSDERIAEHTMSVIATMKKGSRSGVVKYYKFINKLKEERKSENH